MPRSRGIVRTDAEFDGRSANDGRFGDRQKAEPKKYSTRNNSHIPLISLGLEETEQQLTEERGTTFLNLILEGGV